MKPSVLIALPVLLATAPLQPVAAQPAAPAPGNPPPAAGPAAPRFTFTPVEGGVLKLDTQTGKASYCSKETGTFTCVPVPDARDAYEAEIDRLHKEVAQLKGAASGSGTTGPAAPDAGTATGPDDRTLSQIDQMLGYMEYIYKRLRGMVEGTEPPGQKL